MLKSSSLSNEKVRMIQVSKRAYIDGLKKKAFTKNNFINVRFEDLKIERHAKYPDFYGISCWQEWNASNYSDRGFLFIMMDYRNKLEPIIHVRTWQPKAFDDDSQYVSLYHFNIIPSNGK